MVKPVQSKLISKLVALLLSLSELVAMLSLTI